MTNEILERIHNRISFDKGDWRIDNQEIQEDRVIARRIYALGW